MRTRSELYDQIQEITATSSSLRIHLESLTAGQLEYVLDLGREYDSRLYPVNHNEYLGSKHWRRFRQEIVKEREHCEVCNSYYRLHLHHRHYRTVGSENRRDVTLLCKPCHSFVHPYNRHLLPYENSGDKDYIAIPYWFLDDYMPGMTGNEFKVFITIMSFNSRHKRQIKITRIAGFCGISQSTAKQCLKNLETQGFIRVDRRKKINKYYHRLDKLMPPDVKALIKKSTKKGHDG